MYRKRKTPATILAQYSVTVKGFFLVWLTISARFFCEKLQNFGQIASFCEQKQVNTAPKFRKFPDG
jgi:hypothetical protein